MEQELRTQYEHQVVPMRFYARGSGRRMIPKISADNRSFRPRIAF